MTATAAHYANMCAIWRSEWAIRLTWEGVPTDKIFAASVATFRDDIALLSTSLQRQIEITRRNE